MSWAVMPMADYKSVCDKVREKTETTEAIKSGDMTGKVDEVYRAGQLSVFSSSEALQGKAEGNAISITDVSPVEHDVSVKLSSEILTDFSGVKVTAGGKNLFDISQIEFVRTSTNNGDGTLTINDYGVRATKTLAQLCPFLKVGDTVALSFETTSSIRYLYLNIPKLNWSRRTALTLTEDMLNSHLYFYCTRVDSINSPATFSNLQLEYGTTATGYEPYIGHTEYTANANGTVSGVKSKYPAMSFSTDTEGVKISVEYYKDIDKVLQNLAINTALSGGE